MFISTIVAVNPQEAVPSSGRAAWLTQFGPIDQNVSVVTVTLPAETWEEQGVALTPSGAVDLSEGQRGALQRGILAFIAANGMVPATFPVNLAVAALTV